MSQVTTYFNFQGSFIEHQKRMDFHNVRTFSGLGSDDDECNESMMSQEQLAHKREFEQKRRKVGRDHFHSLTPVLHATMNILALALRRRLCVASCS